MLFRIHFEIAIYPNRVQVTDRRSGRFTDFAAEVPFSAPSRLVADAVYLENALAKAIRKAMSGGFILFDAKATVAVGGGEQPTLFEQQAIRGALHNVGFKTVRFAGEPDPEAARVDSDTTAATVWS